jgi:sterol 3beta-glucosyltransferase
MYCFSRHLVPKPPEWQSWVHITGFWLDETQSNANYVPPQALADFLRGGERPIYVGFGSITGINDVEAFFDKVVQAMEQSGERFILLTGWANLGANRKLSDRIHVLESVPHDWLFPQCKAVVHHGGAGTVATGLRAACPTIVLAFFADQFFWASRVVELGVGHAFTAAEFEADRLRAAIVDAASNPEMKRRATQISRQLADEHGVPNARRVIYDFVHRAKIEQRLVGEPVAAHKGSHKKQQN